MDEYMYVEALMLAPFFGWHVQYTAHGHCFPEIEVYRLLSQNPVV